MAFLQSTLPSRGGPEALRLFLVAVVVAAVSWAVRPDRLPFLADSTAYELELSAPLVELQEAFTLFEAGNHLFIDTRPDAGPEVETIAGSFIIREASFADDLLLLMDVLYPEDPVVLFGDGNLMGVSNVAAKLQQRGFSTVLIMRNGLTRWQDAGGEISLPYVPEPRDSWEEDS